MKLLPSQIAFGELGQTDLTGVRALVTSEGVRPVVDGVAGDVGGVVDGTSPLLSVRFDGVAQGMIKVAYAEPGTAAGDWVAEMVEYGISERNLKDGVNFGDPASLTGIEFRLGDNITKECDEQGNCTYTDTSIEGNEVDDKDKDKEPKTK